LLYLTVYVHGVAVSTVSHHTVAIQAPSTLSNVVAHCSVYVSHTFRLIVAHHVNVITGAFASTIFTVLVTSIASFHAVSDTLYLTVYTPGVAVSTVSHHTVTTKTPSISSTAVAHCSVYVSHTFRLIVAHHVNVITGAFASTITFVVILNTADCLASYSHVLALSASHFTIV
jgi:hypothetical protein